MKLSDYVALYLKEKNIKYIFGIIGSANSHLVDSISRLGFTKIVYTHHEQAAVIAAGSYYRATGNLAIALVTAGGGSSNAVTGVLSQWADSTPCIIFAGQENVKQLNDDINSRLFGTQGFNFCQVVENMTKFAHSLREKNQIKFFLDKAFYESMSGRPGPVWLEFPADVQNAQIDLPNLEIYDKQELDYDSYDIKELIEIINQSSKPVLVCGNGVRLSKSNEILKKILNDLNIPVVTSWSGIDVLEYEHKNNFGTFGIYGQRCANFVLQNCDLLIVLGSRLSVQQTGYNINDFAPLAKIIMVLNDKKELSKHDRYYLKYFDDCNNFLQKFYKEQKNLTKNFTSWYEKCVSIKKDYPLIESHHIEDNRTYDNSYVFINSISKLAKNQIIAIGQGSPLPCCHQAFEISENQIMFASNGLGEMGHGLPSAVGCAFNDQGKDVILMDGDGSMMVNLQELQTIVGYNLPIKIFIFNNQGYLFIKHTQKLLFNGRYFGVDDKSGMTLPSFKKISEAFNIPYFSSKENSIADFLEIKGYGIYECFMNPEQDLTPKVKPIANETGMIPMPLHEMSPLVDIHELESIMEITLSEKSYEIRK